MRLSECPKKSKNDDDWKRHFLRGLDPDFHIAIAPYVVDVTDIDALAKKAMGTERAVKIARVSK